MKARFFCFSLNFLRTNILFELPSYFQINFCINFENTCAINSSIKTNLETWLQQLYVEHIRLSSERTKKRSQPFYKLRSQTDRKYACRKRNQARFLNCLVRSRSSLNKNNRFLTGIYNTFCGAPLF